MYVLLLGCLTESGSICIICFRYMHLHSTQSICNMYNLGLLHYGPTVLMVLTCRRYFCCHTLHLNVSPCGCVIHVHVKLKPKPAHAGMLCTILTNLLVCHTKVCACPCTSFLSSSCDVDSPVKHIHVLRGHCILSSDRESIVCSRSQLCHNSLSVTHSQYNCGSSTCA